MSIKLFDVAGERLTAGAAEQDFILISHDPLVVGTPLEFYRMLRAIVRGNPLGYFLHPLRPRIGALRRAIASRQHHPSHLAIGYWSTTPYLFGPGRAVKYIARPASDRTTPMPERLTEHYLDEALRNHLAVADARFDFLVQFQTDPERMPIEDATIEWKEEDSPYVGVATIRMPKQTVAPPGEGRCEAAAFNPWHGLADHRPLGNMNRARRAIYPALSQLRRSRT